MKKKTDKKEKSHTSKQKEINEDECIESEDELEKTKQKLEQVEQDLKIQKDKLLRCYADFDNYKKRVVKEKNATTLKLKNKYLSELLDLKELLLHALDDSNPQEGLRILLNQLEQFFESEEVTYIDCIGKQFNHLLHHAVTTIERSDVENNIIVEEIKKGYMVEDNVLRPSHVIVSKKKSEDEENE